MKRALLLAIPVLASVPLHAERSASLENLPGEARPLIEEAVASIAPHFMAAVDLANKDSGSDRNFAVFATRLKDYGFGKPTSRPPWADRAEHDHPGAEAEKKELTEEEKRKAAEKREKEIAEAAERIGKYEIRHLTGMDKNGDLKTDLEEIEAAIRGYLAFRLQDKLNTDGDGDGRLDLREYALSVPARGEIGEDGVDWHQREHFKEADIDGNGYLDIEEILKPTADWILARARRSHLVFRLPDADIDGDGFLSKEEFAALSGDAASVREKMLPEGKPLEISRAYAELFWVPAETLASLVSP